MLRYEPHPDEVEDIEDFVLRGIDGSLSIVIPSTTRDELIIGRIPETWAYQAISYGITGTEIPIAALAVPLWTP